ncbi:MAG: prepilin-type N-terminal cleavage/methylation domain-containing protein [Candidatus Omnitrophica bacterium]|nr:prepilin-type N-terminal cleavage/methylation domain-containing protein [Candidatus Omnitrophota bacterium]
MLGKILAAYSLSLLKKIAVLSRRLKGARVFLRGVTLIEILVVIIIIGVLVALALPNYGPMKEHSVGKEAQASLKLIAAAEKIYRMEMGFYYPYGGPSNDTTAINQFLRLSLYDTNWFYNVSATTGTFNAVAQRRSGACNYTITHTTTDPLPNPNCN